MLKALELAGFKSFADKTRFEFPKGITVVVGPNGSGKSNVVDAIKWVLGEQSVKSLRGKEMADVIFNGSATRRPMNAAEATLVLDNTARRLPIDTEEVAITRRVYRNGEGEYLINRQPCRLRDIRDLFAGTGLSTEAYSVIEQGKVDILLQSSPRERRLIFEEAAGISRFKAKKIETQRRLERVEQNLLRLSDIVEEVENRLRTVRLQAGKARKYQEYSERLQELRTQIGAVDWRKLTARLQATEAELATARDENAEQLSQVELLEARDLDLDAQIAATEAAMRTIEDRIAQNRERIAAHETTAEHERRRGRDLEEEIARYRRQSASMGVRAEDNHQQLHEITEQLSAAEIEQNEANSRLADEERALADATGQIDALRNENEQNRARHLERMRAASALGNRISSQQAKVTAAAAQVQRGTARLAELEAARDLLSGEVSKLQACLSEAVAATENRQSELQTSTAQLAELRQAAARVQAALMPLRQRHSASTQRASVLEELDNRLEGLNAGVKQILTQAKGDSPGAYRQVRGLVADLLHVRFETAALVEVALGELAHCLVVADGGELIEHLGGEHEISGRVTFLRLDALPPKTHLDNADLRGLPGVIGRADEFVETTPEFADLARRLLGRTWIVEDLSCAMSLADSAGRGLSFVTNSRDLLAADGTLQVGPRQAASGLISRRSELRGLKQQIETLGDDIDRQAAVDEQLQGQIAAADLQVATFSSACQQARDAQSHQQLRLTAAEERLTHVVAQATALREEWAATKSDHEKAETALAGMVSQSAELESAVSEFEEKVAAGVAAVKQLEPTRQRHNRAAGAAKVDAVKCEQRVAHLLAQREQLQRDQLERHRALSDTLGLLHTGQEKLRTAERAILQAESALAELYLRKESFAVEASGYVERRAGWREEKQQIAADLQRVRARIRRIEARVHAKELACGELNHERTALADRLREDYGIDLAALEYSPSGEELQERAAVEAEIADLRSKLNSIGGVNLDALAELDELEARFGTLSTQHADLASAKAALEQIIEKINVDSRRLFAETLHIVREHFQSLFRKLFGGGQADIVLDESADMLDGGIEIVARPPGKEPRSISLLSGGEKTLSCVALLLAIFRSRPSPFCVLDEVDAALDEANIERFMGVLDEFLAFTQFIVVTHSKKTMTSANTLYGVTMQESGVSKRVSVQFTDVGDNGEILNVRESDAPSPEQSDETQAA